MARVIVILGLMIAITAGMFWLTRKPPVSDGVAATSPSTTVPLADLKTPLPDVAAVTDAVPAETKDAETQSLTSVDPREPTNAVAPSATTTASAQDVTSGPVAGAAPSIGTAGIDRSGTASFTGTATPGDTVTLVWDNKPMNWATADEKGNWTIEFKAPVTDKEHELFASAQSKDGTVIIGPQRAYIGPPDTKGGLASVTLKSAGQPKQTADASDATGTTAPEPKTGIVVEKITGGEGGLTILSGKADAGATIKAAINGKPAGETLAAADGTWSLAATNPSGKAARAVRLELVDQDGAKLDEADVPYKVPAAAPIVAAASPKTSADFPSVLTSEPDSKAKLNGKTRAEGAQDLAALFRPETQATADKPKRQVIRVRKGDSLWRISKRHLGNGKKWAAFYKLNKRKIDNPNMIFPGQTLVIPG